MNMGIEEAGNHVSTGAVDHVGEISQRAFSRSSDTGDLPVLDEKSSVLQRCQFRADQQGRAADRQARRL
jgi:hypothetical protein